MNERADSDLRQEIVQPEPGGYLAPGGDWDTLLALLVVGLLAVAAWRLWQWWRDLYRREALRRLAELEQAFATDALALRQLPELLRRAALSMPGGVPVACMHGEAWQAFLQQCSGEPLPADFTRQLAQLAYAPTAQAQELAQTRGPLLLALARRWVETHHAARRLVPVSTG